MLVGKFFFLFFSYMFWIDWGDIFKIEKCGMNGDFKLC